MMRMFVLLATVIALAEPAVAASTPAELAQGLNRAAQSGDVDAFTAAMSGASRQAMADAEAAGAKLAAARNDFLLALDTRFGSAPTGGGARVPIPDRKALLSRFVNIELVSVDNQSADHAQLHLKTVTKGIGDRTVTTEDTLPAVSESGDWKLDLTGVTQGVIASAAQRTAALTQVAQAIRSNTFKDRFSAQIALAKARRSLASGGGPGK